MMKGKLNRLISWCQRSLVLLRRLHHSCGFGIQSPSAYRFERHIINEHYPYYAYAGLQKAFPGEGRLAIKLARLYFRLSNEVQAEQWTLCVHRAELYGAYIQAGCHKSQVVRCGQGCALDSVSASDALVMAVDDRWRQVFEAFVSHVTPHAVLIVEGIYASKEAKAAWRQMTADQRSGVTFDLYDCGIILFDPSKTKQCYTINF